MVIPKNWIELKIRTNPDTEEIISNFLFEIGCTGCSSEDDYLKAYFDETTSASEIVEKLNTYLEELSALGIEISGHDIDVEVIANRDWNSEWKKTLKPIYIFPDLIIKPSWVKFTVPENAVVIKMDPKMAFGTGTHATTQLMMKLMRSQVSDAERVLDVGTGSGILSVVAVKLFGCQVIAYDIDPVAVIAARENCIENEVVDAVHLFSGTLDCLKKSEFDLILANINRVEIEKLLPELPRYIKSDGLVILSGILAEEDRLIQKSLNKFNFKTLIKSIQDEWMGLVVKMLYI